MDALTGKFWEDYYGESGSFPRRRARPRAIMISSSPARRESHLLRSASYAWDIL